MSRRAVRRLAAALLALLVGVAAGCAEGAGSSATRAPAPVAAPDVLPDVPALHPDTDHLDETVVTITTAAGDRVRVDAKVAATEAARRRGLMEVEVLPGGIGMLFVFDGGHTGGFWMWDTLVPLDIAFSGADGRIHTILAMEPCRAAVAAACPVHLPGEPYRTALEVPEGWLAEQGVAVGDRIGWQDAVPAD